MFYYTKSAIDRVPNGIKHPGENLALNLSTANTRPQPVIAQPPAPALNGVERPASRGSIGGGSFGGGSFGGGGGGGGGCFHSSCTILKADGSLSSVSDIVAGDRLACSVDGAFSATVRCVIATRIPSGRTRMVTFSSGLCVTPGHPVLINGTWSRPKDVRKPTMVPCEFYYNFLLEPDAGTTLVVNSSLCTALGHGVKGDMREHAFWGCWNALADAIRAVDKVGWEKGWVQIEEIEDSLISNNAGDWNNAVTVVRLRGFLDTGHNYQW